MTDDYDDDSLHFLPEKELSQDVQALINNGLDFLDQARKELDDSKPKFSVVSFWTAVEILLKVPLAHEHWSLVCSRKKIPNKEAYLSGDFQSITYEETCKLLEGVLGKKLHDDTHDVFDKVRKHRNRVVHFYHIDFSDDQMKQILTEQADAWFRLNQLIRKDWRSVFGEELYDKLTRDESRMLRTSHYYIEAKFNSLAPELKKLSLAGKKITRCPVCDKNAGVHNEFRGNTDNTHHETNCRVCGGITEVYLMVTCPDCSTKQRLSSDDEGDFICTNSNCEYTEPKHDLLDESNMTQFDYHDEGGPASCSDCDGHQTICGFGDRYLCVSCLALHDAIGSCENCGESSTNVPDMSSFLGCSNCRDSLPIYRDD